MQREKIFEGSAFFDTHIKRLIGETHDGSFGDTENLFHFLIKKGYGVVDFNHNIEAKLGFIEAIKTL